MVARKSQMFMFELLVAITLLSSLFLVRGVNYFGANHFLTVDSFLGALSKVPDVRKAVITENLSQSVVTADWGVATSLCNRSFNDYFIEVRNLTKVKLIKGCSHQGGDIIVSEKVIGIYNNTFARFRILRLGVCY